ncbi:MAG TPA: hypothetical protein DD856_08175, partial [Sulfobacillus sp.]|nr:hypothetical protein [Sulfobacillus sp.]
ALPTLLIISAVAWFLSVHIERTVLGELSSIVEWINQVDDGHFEPLPVWDTGPWGQLTYALNQMASRLATAQQERDVFLASVAHELKTPLTVLRGNLEGLMDGALTPTPERWAALTREINRLTRLVNDLLLIETMRQSPPAFNRKHYDPREQLASLILRFEPLARMKGVEMTGESQVHEVYLDQDRMEQILVNLVDNALRHTPEGGRICIRLQRKMEGKKDTHQIAMLEWCIEDSGPGIPASSASLVLQPFFRDPRSRGAGLGLAVSAALVQAQGGTLQISTSELGGAKICLSLPFS